MSVGLVALLAAVILLGGGVPGVRRVVTFAADNPLVVVGPEGVTPERLEVHVGEVVRWRAASGGVLRIDLDRHPGAHEVVERAAEVRAMFRLTGEHTYTGAVVDDRRTFRGVIVVLPASGEWDHRVTCARESSDRVCFEP